MERLRRALRTLDNERDFRVQAGRGRRVDQPEQRQPHLVPGALLRKRRDGAHGDLRVMCGSCGRSFTPTAGTVFEAHKIPAADWTEFLIETFAYESINGMTRANRRSDTTLPYWLAKLFAVLGGVQDAATSTSSTS